MEDEFLVTCPYCGEAVEIYVEPDLTGTFVQDCEVCCNPWHVRVTYDGGQRYIDVTRADGSELKNDHQHRSCPCAVISPSHSSSAPPSF